MTNTRRILAVLIVAAFAALGTDAAGEKTTKPAGGTAAGKTVTKPESTIPVQATTNGSDKDPHDWWRENCDTIKEDIKKMDGDVDIAFVGDSITVRWKYSESWKKQWASYRILNLGIGGDQTQHVLWRLQNGQLDGYKARVFVVMIGTNNCWTDNVVPADVAAGVKAILDLIQSKQPKAKILLLSIFPLGAKPNPGRELRKSVNALISKFAGGSVTYMDIGDKFLEPDGTISAEVMGDELHLAEKGFDIWADSIKDTLKKMLGGSKSTKKTTK